MMYTKPRPGIIVKDTTRGLTTTKVKTGTKIFVLAIQKGTGMMLVRVGSYGQPFVVSPDCVQYT